MDGVISIAYTVSGVEAVLADLARIKPENAGAIVVDYLRDTLAPDAATYPPELPNQRYVRTGTLRRGWLEAEPTVSASGTDLLAVLENSTTYGDYVMGDAQAAVHQGRWRTVDMLMDAHEAGVAQAIEQGLVP